MNLHLHLNSMMMVNYSMQVLLHCLCLWSAWSWNNPLADSHQISHQHLCNLIVTVKKKHPDAAFNLFYHRDGLFEVLQFYQVTKLDMAIGSGAISTNLLACLACGKLNLFEISFSILSIISYKSDFSECIVLSSPNENQNLCSSSRAPNNIVWILFHCITGL